MKRTWVALKIAGFGTPKDYVGAFSLAEQAAWRKDLRALYSLAWFYQQGVGTEVDKERAFSLWKEAAESGNPSSQYAVAYCLVNGSGTGRDVSAARDWCELAIRNGFQEPPAQELLEKIRSELRASLQPVNLSTPDEARRKLDERIGTRRPVGTRLLAWLNMSFTVLQYRLLGLEEQTYHLRQSRSYEQAGNYERAVKHARSFLAITEHSETRARLAHSYHELSLIKDQECETQS